MKPEEMTKCIYNMLEQVAFHGMRQDKAYYDLMMSAYDLWSFMQYDSGCDWSAEELWNDVPLAERTGEPFDF